MEQAQFDFEAPFKGQNTAVWTPRDIWVHLTQRALEFFKEDRRLERKGRERPNLAELAEYYSTYSNTPEGGLIVYGVKNNGENLRLFYV